MTRNPAAQPPVQGLRILIADDNQSDRMILQAIVRREGHEVLLATNGREAVELFKQHAPDIVLMDALMPVMNGLEASRAIKTLADSDLVPIIFSPPCRMLNPWLNASTVAATTLCPSPTTGLF